uniref:Fibrinogen C-terminal domain-containing protein n=1 Tax=Caenorhabditis tropicalis TaxID=1561998 RepID=A0A1I7T2U9_9PELO
MKLILLLVTFFLSCQAACIDKCECPKFSELNTYGVDYKEDVGCALSATCSTIGERMYIGSGWDTTEIQTKSDANLEMLVFRIYSPDTGDMMTNFGIICENGAWYATKYPLGISYLDENDERKENVGTPEEFNGRKSLLETVVW